jgi:6-phosphogluconolactonase (cycloisomerase 2 family)
MQREVKIFFTLVDNHLLNLNCLTMKRIRLGIAVIFLIATTSCSKNMQSDPSHSTSEPSSSFRPPNSREGFVYTMSNDGTQNDILIYQQKSNGTLSYLRTTHAGGAGLGAMLKSQGSLQISASHLWLFTVNAGSNTISIFSVGADGRIVLINTVSSNGTMPVSLAVYNDLLYVVNAGSANISGFRVGDGGTLTYIAGSSQSLNTSSAEPSVISFSSDGIFLRVMETKTSTIATFPVDKNGVAGAGTFTVVANAPPFNPGDKTSSGNDIYLYILDVTAHSIGEFKKTNSGSLQNIGEMTGLPVNAAGLAAF